LNQPVYVAHAGEEFLFVLIPVLVVLAIRAIAKRRRPPP
jgi:hypothetical protein